MATDVLNLPRGRKWPLWGAGLGLIVVLFATVVSNPFEALITESSVGNSDWEPQAASNCSDGWGSFDAFIPGMRGSGACNRGGFVPGTNVITVTNRNDSGSGSFREAIEANCPKVIVFGVAGVITNGSSALETKDCDNWSIVGSSAPGNITLYGGNTSSGIQIAIFGSNATLGHMTIPASTDADSGQGNDSLALGNYHQIDQFTPARQNIIVYNSSFMWAPYGGGAGSSEVECLPADGNDYSNILFWQLAMVAATGAQGHQLLFNTCPGANTIRTFYTDALSRVPLERVPDYVHANNVAINMQQQFTRIQPCDGGVFGPQANPFQNLFLNNYYADGPNSSTGAFIFINDGTSCTTVQMWEEGTAGMKNYPTNNIQDCSNHGCTSGMGSFWTPSLAASLLPTGYVPEAITNTVQGHTDFVTKIGQYAGARPTDRFQYVQDKIDQSINTVDGVGPVSTWNGWGAGGSGATVASEGGAAQVFDTPQSGYDPTDGAQNGCGTDMPTGAEADVISPSNGLTALHEYAIDCWMDSVMPVGYRESL